MDEHLYLKLKHDPVLFVEKMWGLTPTEEGEEFTKGENITHHQHELLQAVKEAIHGGRKQISVRSGHGVGKTSTLAWVLIWYLFSRKESKISCTAPSADQIYDVLWSETKKWIDRMPEPVANKFDWTSTHIRVAESPNTWFARAKTAREENAEAIAGLHADHLLILVDEASGVPESIYQTLEGSMTEQDVLIILISNPTRTTGYFYDTHNKHSRQWNTFDFSAENSPLVGENYIQKQKTKYGADSDEYKIRVKGQFPEADRVDDDGYTPLLLINKVDIIDKEPPYNFTDNAKMGIDPAGSGSNKTIWVVRDDFMAVKVASSAKSTPKAIAQKTMTLLEKYPIEDGDIVVDNFGKGANISQQMALAGFKIRAVNVGDNDVSDEFLNIRAKAFWELRKWLKQGGSLVRAEGWDKISDIPYRRKMSGKLQVKPKKKLDIESPDLVDALMLTFTKTKSNFRSFFERKMKEKRFKSNNKNSGGKSYSLTA